MSNTHYIYKLDLNSLFNKHKLDQYWSDVSLEEIFDQIGPIE